MSWFGELMLWKRGGYVLGIEKSACVYKRLTELHVCLLRADAACMLLQLGCIGL